MATLTVHLTDGADVTATMGYAEGVQLAELVRCGQRQQQSTDPAARLRPDAVIDLNAGAGVERVAVAAIAGVEVRG